MYQEANTNHATRGVVVGVSTSMMLRGRRFANLKCGAESRRPLFQRNKKSKMTTIDPHLCAGRGYFPVYFSVFLAVYPFRDTHCTHRILECD